MLPWQRHTRHLNYQNVIVYPFNWCLAKFGDPGTSGFLKIRQMRCRYQKLCSATLYWMLAHWQSCLTSVSTYRNPCFVTKSSGSLRASESLNSHTWPPPSLGPKLYDSHLASMKHCILHTSSDVTAMVRITWFISALSSTGFTKIFFLWHDSAQETTNTTWIIDLFI